MNRTTTLSSEDFINKVKEADIEVSHFTKEPLAVVIRTEVKEMLAENETLDKAKMSEVMLIGMPCFVSKLLPFPFLVTTLEQAKKLMKLEKEFYDRIKEAEEHIKTSYEAITGH